MQLTPILKKLEKFFVAQHSIAYVHLQDGSKQAEIEKKIAPFNLSFPPELFELFMWKNGLNDSHRLKVKDAGLFVMGGNSLEWSLSAYEKFVERKFLDPMYFPVFESGGGDFMVINCDPDDEHYGYMFMHSFVLHPEGLAVYYESLFSQLQCVLECFEAGGYFFVDGTFEMNGKLSNLIEEKYIIEDEEGF